jgi:hypothetical protein
MSNTTDPEDRRPRQDRNENLRSETARDEAFPGGEPTRAVDRIPVTSAEREYRPDTLRADTLQSDTGLSIMGQSDMYGADTPVTDPNVTDRQTAVARQKEQFGGMKVGSAFFGWLAATGMAVLLTALLAAAGAAVGLASNTNLNDAVNQVASNGTAGLVGIIVLLVILFVSYYSGGYVAGRMARFSGAKQGFMVWVWALIAAVVVALLGLIAGQRYDILANLNSFPRIPVNEGQQTAASIIAAVVVALIALVGAVLGGLAGMHYHRKVDKAGFTPD